MLKDCIEIFNKEVEKHCQNPGCDEISFITDNYTLSDGTFLLLDSETGEIKEELTVNKNTDKGLTLYREFAKKDYLSKLIDMNKPIDGKKTIHSNNYLSFYVKKESIKDKLIKETVNGYYDILKNPLLNKYKGKKESEKIYKNFIEKNGEVDDKKVEKYHKFILKFFFEENPLVSELSKEKNYLKLFFDVDIQEYRRESERYIIPNIYNSNEYNYPCDKSGEIFGFPNNNIGLNTKKPFLENKTRLEEVPYYISQEEVLKQKLFFDHLLNLASNREYYIYINEEGIKSLKNGELPEKDFSGYFLRIKKSKECEIHDFDIIENISTDIEIKVDDLLNIKYGNYPQALEYGTISKLNELLVKVNEIFYSKWLLSNFFTESKDIKIKNDSGALKNILLSSRIAWINWFYKGNTRVIKSTFAKFSLELIKNSINNDNFMKAREQFNLRIAILEFLKEKDNEMSEKISKFGIMLDEKINSKTSPKIESDDEYYFAVGQLVNYFISLNKGSKKNHSLINPILQAKTNAKLKKELKKMFVKYDYAISTNSLRFENLFGMICRYEPEKNINDEILLGGYLYNSLMYKKGE
ncbi:MAG: CRISPR-associated protein Cse4 [bacterium]